MTYFYVALGAIFGAVARFAISHFFSEKTQHHGFPYGTLFVNITGSLLAGFFLAWTANKTHLDDRWRLLVVTGFCGAYTTFSAFAWESVDYLRQGKPVYFAANFLLNNVVCLLAAYAGMQVAAQRG